ncbi:MAG: trypsin-like serine protease [Pseudanabaenaceae cyanobacterium bins.68]|nr:trypsin-like serine protease [Pseudanabaenaceae cyanobacterium bins.68]
MQKLFLLAALIIGLSPTASAWGIIGGAAPDSPTNRIVPNTDPTFAGVGTLSNGCTGTAISPLHILTAAHCGPATAFIVNNPDNTQTTYPGSTTFHPSASFPFNDLAILTLDSPLPNTVPTYGFYNQPLALGTSIVMVGYGASGSGDLGATVGGNNQIKRRGENMVDSYLDSNQDIVTTYQPLFVFDFDGPDNSTNLIGGSTLGNEVEATLGSLDSGSPSFVFNNGNYLLAGINSFVANGVNPSYQFGSFGGGVDLAQYQTWISGVTSSTVTPVPFEFSPLGAIALLGIVIAWRRAKGG